MCRGFCIDSTMLDEEVTRSLCALEEGFRDGDATQVTGWLRQWFPDAILSDREKLRWVVLDEVAGTLSLWKQPPCADHQSSSHQVSSRLCKDTTRSAARWPITPAPRKPLQSFPMKKLTKL